MKNCFSCVLLLALGLLVTAIPADQQPDSDEAGINPDIIPLYDDNPVKKCPKLDDHYEPKNIYDLRVNSIKVIAAFGDSITAGLGIHGKSGTLEEFRGESAPIGGDPDAITQATMFKYYNPKLFGYSKGSHFLEWTRKDYQPDEDVLNAAQSGAEASDLIFQAEYFLDELKKGPADFEKDWKLLTVFIGANDACTWCEEHSSKPVEEAAEIYANNIRGFLNTMKSKLPRALINIWPVFNISDLYKESDGFYCTTVHTVLSECQCAFSDDKQERTYLDEVLTAYRYKLYDIQMEWANVTDDFAVVVQPFTSNCTITSDFLSSLDCFHPNLKGHQLFSVNAWNSLITPPANKKWYMDENPTLECPTQDTLLYVGTITPPERF